MITDWSEVAAQLDGSGTVWTPPVQSLALKYGLLTLSVFQHGSMGWRCGLIVYPALKYGLALFTHSVFQRGSMDWRYGLTISPVLQYRLAWLTHSVFQRGSMGWRCGFIVNQRAVWAGVVDSLCLQSIY